MKHIIAYVGQARTYLGVMQEAYVPLYAPIVNRRAGIEGTLQRAPYSVESGREWVRSLDKSKGKDEVFAILARIGRELRYIGHTGIHHIDWSKGTGTTGSIIVSEQGRGKGYGTEAKLLLLYHCFNVLGLRKVHSTVKAWNAASLGHLLKAGYQIVGRRKREVFHEGTYVDEILLEIFRDEWEPVWKQYRKTDSLPSLTDDQRTLIRKETGA